MSKKFLKYMIGFFFASYSIEAMSTPNDLRFVEYAEYVGNESLKKHGTKVSISLEPDYYPYVIANPLNTKETQVKISHGVLASYASEDELAYLIIRSVISSTEFSVANRQPAPKESKELASIQYFIDETDYNPAAALQFFSRNAGIISSLNSYKRPHESNLPSHEDLHTKKELVKMTIEKTAWSEKDLSARLDQFKAKKVEPDTLLRLRFLHYFYGPDYNKWLAIDWQLDHPVVPVAMGVGIALGALQYFLKTLTFIAHATARTYQRVDNAAISPKGRALFCTILTLELSVLGLLSYHTLIKKLLIPPEMMEKPIDELTELLADLKRLKDGEVDESKIENFLKKLGDYQSDEYWTDKLLQKNYDELLNLVLKHKILLNHFNVSNKNHLHLFNPQLLYKLAKAIKFDSFDRMTRIKTYRKHSKSNSLQIDLVPVAASFAFFLGPEWYLEDLDESNDDLSKVNELSEAMKPFEVLTWVNLHLNFVEPIATHQCALFFKHNADENLSLLIESAKQKKRIKFLEDLKYCLAHEISQATDYPSIIRQRLLLAKYFSSDLAALRQADEQIFQFIDTYNDVSHLVDDIKQKVNFSFNPYDLGSANGEALIAKPDLIQDLTGIRKVIGSDLFWSVKPKDDNLNEKASKAMSDIRRAAKGYNIELTETLHGLLISKLKQFEPNLSLDERETIWKELTSRGSSVHSDKFFWEIYEHSDEKNKARLTSYAISLLYNKEIKQKMTDGVLFSSSEFLLLKEDKSLLPEERKRLVLKLIELSMKNQGFSLGHSEILEKLSTAIESTSEESTLIENSKTNNTTASIENIDEGLQLFTELISEIRTLSKEQQWALILFLVGHSPNIDASLKKFLADFSITPLRLYENFSLLPRLYKYKLVDTILSQKDGVLETITFGEGWTEKIVTYFASMVQPEAQKVVYELMDAYITALNTPGYSFLKSSLFTHLLISSATNLNQRKGLVAEICKYLGAFGIKLGQFLLATKILPQEENDSLTNLEDNARDPSREQVYQDLREILASDTVPYRVKRVLGGASLKYVVLATKDNGQEIVLKILAKDAIIHTPMEEKIFKRIAQYLVDKYGSKYSILKSAVHFASEAIRRELSFEDEVARSRLASAHMYRNCEDKSVRVIVVQEKMISSRLIEAEFAPGTGIHKLETNKRAKIAKTIIACELDNFFQNSTNAIDGLTYFDPDRHFGNYRISETAVYPIDFGQLHVMTSLQRDRIIDLTAMASILKHLGIYGYWISKTMNKRIAKKLLHLFNSDTSDIEKISRLSKALAKEFSTHHDDKSITSYYRLISILEESNLAIDNNERIALYDIPKGIMQLSRLSEFVSQDPDTQTVDSIFTQHVSERAALLVKEFNLEDPSYMTYLQMFLE